MSDFAWLIEAPGQRYLAARHLGDHHFHWTQDHNAALRFYSKAQCDAAMMAIRQLATDLFGFESTLGNAAPVEHGWMDHPQHPADEASYADLRASGGIVGAP